MKHKPFQVDIKSRGTNFSKVIDKACSQAGLEMRNGTLDVSGIVLSER